MRAIAPPLPLMRSEAGLSHPRRLAWTAAALATSGSTTLVFNVIVARVLSREDFGHVARVFAGAMIVAQVTMASVAPALTRVIAQPHEERERLRLAPAGTRLLVVAVVPTSLLCVVLAAAGLTPDDPLSILLGWALALVYPIYFGLKGILFAVGLVRTYGLLELATDIVFFALLAVFAWLLPSATLAVFSLAYGLFVIVTAWLIRRSADRTAAIHLDRSFVRFGALALVATYTSVTQAAAVVLIAGRLGSSADAAEIAAVVALTTPLGLLPQAAGILSFVDAARKGDDFGPALRATLRSISALVGLGCFAFGVLAGPIIEVVLGPRYAGILPTLLVALLGASVAPAIGPVASALSGEGRVGLNASISFAAFVIAIVGAVVTVPKLGALGAAIALAGAYTAAAGTVFAFGRRRYGLRVADVAGAPALAASGICLGSVALSLPLRVVAAVACVAAIALSSARARARAVAAARRYAAVTVSVLAALGLAVSVSAKPQLAVLAAAGVAAACAATIELRYVVAGLLVYLPLEGVILTHLPGGAVAPLHYGPEFLLDAIVLFRLVPRVREVWLRAAPLTGVLLLTVCVWVASAAWNGIAATTAAIGFRSEFRFALLLLVPLLSQNPRSDARFYGRLLASIAALEIAVFATELVGGDAVRSLLATNYGVSLGGVAVTGTTAADAVGTFPHYNLFGTYLAFVFAVVAAAGTEGLGVPRLLWRSLLAASAVSIVLCGSRESAIALVACGVVFGWRRFARPLPAAAFVAGLAAIAAVVVVGSERVTPANAASAGSSPSAADISRFRTLLSPTIFSTNPYDPQGNFRLYLLTSNARLVHERSPLLGFGIGSATDPRMLQDGTSPLYRSSAGRRAVEFGFNYDGNWSMLLLETGAAGVVAIAFLFVRAGRIALSTRHWVGAATTALLVQTAVLGFFSPILQLRAPTAVMWLALGLTLALAHAGHAEVRR